jgi:hypothetical protein
MRYSLVLVTLLACTDSKTSPPSAPTSLAVTSLGGGAHLTWIDTSANESEFAIMRQQIGVDAAMKEIATVPFDATLYHDEPIVHAAMYTYQIVAINDGGEAASNTATFVAP